MARESDKGIEGTKYKRRRRMLFERRYGLQEIENNQTRAEQSPARQAASP